MRRATTPETLCSYISYDLDISIHGLMNVNHDDTIKNK